MYPPFFYYQKQSFSHVKYVQHISDKMIKVCLIKIPYKGTINALPENLKKWFQRSSNIRNLFFLIKVCVKLHYFFFTIKNSAKICSFPKRPSSYFFSLQKISSLSKNVIKCHLRLSSGQLPMFYLATLLPLRTPSELDALTFPALTHGFNSTLHNLVVITRL